MTSPETHRDRALAVMRRGHYQRLQVRSAICADCGEDPKKGIYSTVLKALEVVKAQMRAAGQEP